MELKLYRCAHCGNVVYKVVDCGVPVFCCGEKMEEITPNTTDAAVEKHAPVIEVSGHAATISVGSVAHPMQDDHYIPVIAAVNGNQITFTNLKPGEEPKAVVSYGGGKIEAWEYCNKHGFWKTEQ